MELIEGVKVKRLEKFADDRGFFMEILRDEDGFFRKIWTGFNVFDLSRGNKSFSLS